MRRVKNAKTDRFGEPVEKVIVSDVGSRVAEFTSEDLVLVPVDDAVLEEVVVNIDVAVTGDEEVSLAVVLLSRIVALGCLLVRICRVYPSVGVGKIVEILVKNTRFVFVWIVLDVGAEPVRVEVLDAAADAVELWRGEEVECRGERALNAVFALLVLQKNGAMKVRRCCSVAAVFEEELPLVAFAMEELLQCVEVLVVTPAMVGAQCEREGQSLASRH